MERSDALPTNCGKKGLFSGDILPSPQVLKNNQAVNSCIAMAVERFSFPTAGKDNVQISLHQDVFFLMF